MCIDYQNLNDCTEDALWPIPNMNEMLRRIGAHKVFATLDLTQGYHQAPLTFAARALWSDRLYRAYGPYRTLSRSIRSYRLLYTYISSAAAS